MLARDSRAMKIPVFCSLIPTELIVHLGHKPCFIDGSELALARAGEYHSAFHENLCSYSKALYDYFLTKMGTSHRGAGGEGEYDLIIIPAACDAIKKLHNALKPHIPKEKLYLLDMPKAKGDSANKFLAEKFEKLGQLLPLEGGGKEGVTTGSSTGSDGIKIAILGANIPMGVVDGSLKKFGFEAVHLNHCLTKSNPDVELLAILKERGVEEYAKKFLEKNSCPRTDDFSYKKAIIKQIKEDKIKGLIMNALKFCDFQPFDFKYFKDELGQDFPMLMIEHELTADYEGQTMTRLEAFFENIKNKLTKGTRPHASRAGRGRSDLSSYYVGIDSGSHATKLVCINGKGDIVSREVVPTGTSVAKSSEVLLKRLKELHGIGPEDIGRIVATGYGRNKVVCADDVLTEISCHALGAHKILGSACTIIDIGGQDSKAIKVDADGGVVRFAMNDKCAAGTGRFLEVMAAKLEMSLEEFAELAFIAKKHVPISSMCSVFAESEVISLIASGSSREAIAKGIHKAIAERTIALAKRIEGTPPYYMAGGVAKNRGLVKELGECLGLELEVIDYPQFSGALGAALIALNGKD